jgi:hypothetical protein
MARISELRKVLKEEDWQWSPYFRITILKSAAVKKAISAFYFAFDKMMDEWEHNKHKTEFYSHLEQEWERQRLNCRDALMTYSQRKPIAVRHHRFIEKWLIPELWKNQSNLWYFALGWQFQEWYDHIKGVYDEYLDKKLDSAYVKLDSSYQKVPEKEKGLVQQVQLELLQRRLDNLLDDSDEDWYQKKQLIDIWQNLRGFELNTSEMDEVLGWTCNRLSVAKSPEQKQAEAKEVK